jgi:hypothetical protein
MAIQLSTDVRNARLDSIESTIGTSPTLEVRSGEKPANCAAEDTGTLLAEIELPSDWMQAASDGSAQKNSTWSTNAALATGEAGHFRIKDSEGTCHMQGTVSEDGGGGDMELQQATADIIEGQAVTVSTFVITDGNA